MRSESDSKLLKMGRDMSFWFFFPVVLKNIQSALSKAIFTQRFYNSPYGTTNSKGKDL